jgi:copper chaperone CopZ
MMGSRSEVRGKFRDLTGRDKVRVKQELKIKKSEMKNILMVLGLLMSAAMFAQKSGTDVQAKKSKNARYDIEVNGNCEQCKARIEKAAFGVKGVKSAEWHPDDHVLHLIINEEKTTLTEVENALAKAGHDNQGARSRDADYQHLPACCRYERK